MRSIIGGINNYGLFVGLYADKISNKMLKLFKNSIYKALNSLKKDNLNEIPPSFSALTTL